MKKFLKKFSFYRELRYIYRSFVLYRTPFSYLYHRFIVGPKIKRVKKPLDNPVGTDEYSVHLLCSHRDVMMMLWSLASWHRAVPNSGQVYIHEDGSFTKEDRQIIAKFLPRAKMVDFQWASEQAEKLWLASFSKAREYRSKAVMDKANVFAIKLIDPRFVGTGQKRLILDTDLLWLKEPKYLLNNIHQNKLPFAMNIYNESMKPTEGMDFVFNDGSTLDSKIAGVNSGVVGYELGQFGLDDLEKFCARVGDNTNPHFVEQAGYAWILSKKQDFTPLSEVEYQIKGPVTDQTALKHYTGPRREQFWFEGVRLLKKEIL